MRTRAAVIFVLLLVVLALGACGDDNGGKDNPSKTAATGGGGSASASASASANPSGSASASASASTTDTANGGKDLDSATILNQNKNSVVKILTTTPQGDGGGSGIVWQDGTHVLTAAHVVVGAGSIKVVDPNDGSRSYPAKTVALSSCDDVALLVVDRATDLKPVKLGSSDAMKPGDRVVTLGFPDTISSGPNNAIVTDGTISRVHATFDWGGQRDLLQHTAPINPGNSGGPLFNAKGEVVGLNAYSARGRQAENYAIAINEAKAVADELKGGKNLDYLGITLEPNDRDFAQQNDLAYIDGLVVTAVDPGSPADKATPGPFKYGFLIFEVNGTSVETVGQFCDIIRSHNAGETLDIRFGAFDNNGEAFNNFHFEVVMQ